MTVVPNLDYPCKISSRIWSTRDIDEQRCN